MNYKDEHKEILRKGYQFDPELECFLVAKDHIKSFIKPEGYEEWEVTEYDTEDYYKKRILEEIGITEEENSIDLYLESKQKSKKTQPNKIFTPSQKGDIEMTCYSLYRDPYFYSLKGAFSKSTTKTKDQFDVITRYSPHREKIEGRKYNITGKTGTHPFFHPSLIDAFESGKEIKTLCITEGYFKGFKATKEGIPTVALSSIQHYRDKKVDAIHPEIIELIKRCKVKNVVILWDGDALDISTKALSNGESISKRPKSFFSAAEKMRDSLKEFVVRNTQIYFARIKSEGIPNNPKGIDDLINEDITTERIAEDFELINERPGYFIDRINITSNLKELESYFHINSYESFYNFHQDKIGSKPFIYFGTKYQYDEKESQLNVIIPGALKQYVRVGTEYFRHIKYRNQHNVLVPELKKWNEHTIVQDHGKSALNHIPKLLRFINYPEHENYQKIIDGSYNRYYELKHKPEPGKWDTIETYLKHVFDDQYEYALDYIQLLYKKPQQKLPIVCLVSKEQETGKSTFLKLLKYIFQSNVTTVGNAELASEFNSGWATKLIVGVEETLVDKALVMNKIKTASTESQMNLRAMHSDLVEIDIFLKFVFTSNQEDNFIRVDDEDRRFWVRKVPKIGKLDPLFDEKIESEVEAFIYFLTNRKLSVPKKLTRMWFDPKTLETEAMRKLISNSNPSVAKEIRSKLVDMFLDFGEAEIKMTVSDLKEQFKLTRFEDNYLKKVLNDHFKVKKFEKDGKSVVTRYKIKYWAHDGNGEAEIKKSGRPYVFKRADFVEEKAEPKKENPNQLRIE